jgi:hypothetical protein
MYFTNWYLWIWLFIYSLIEGDDVDRILKQRLRNLKLLALRGHDRTSTLKCDSKRIVQITEIQFGRSGNQIIEFIHGIWIARHYNRTFMVPDWMMGMLTPFNTTFIHSLFCFTDYFKPTPGVDVLEVESQDSFFVFDLFRRKEFAGLFRLRDNQTIFLKDTSEIKISNQIVEEVSQLYVRIYSALWSHPIESIYDPALWLIQNHLGNNLRYTSVHKRSLEGGCSKILAESVTLSHFPPYEIPMNDAEWKGNIRAAHPLCEMQASFVLETIKLNNRSSDHTKLFIAFDGRGDVSDYKKSQNSIFIDVLKSQGYQTHDKVEYKYHHIMFIEMFIAMHSDLFIMNPRSTFSWQIFVIRACLGLYSVPVIMNDEYDLYLQLPRERSSRTPWVGWKSIYEALQHSE